jgi:ribose transport system substrate-binding protein
VIALALTACGAGSASSGGSAASCSTAKDSAALQWGAIPDSLNAKTTVPPISQMTIRGDDLGTKQKLKPVWWNTVKVSTQQAEAICKKKLTAVILDWDKVQYNLTLRAGIGNVLDALGIKLLRTTSFNFDPNGLAGDLAAILPLHPDIIFTGGTIDPNQFAALMAPATQAGIQVVSWNTGARQWDTGQGKPLTAMVAYDFYNLGQQMAEAIHEKYPNGANFGYIHWINNVLPIHLRETGLLDGLKKYPNIKVISDGKADPGSANGFNDPNAAQAATQAFLIRHPEVNVLFAPWEDPPGVGEEAALKSLHKENSVDIVTMDLGAQGAAELAGNGPITVDMAEGIYDGGRVEAMLAGLAAIGVKTPPFVLVPTYAANQKNLTDAWNFMHGPAFPCCS